MSRQSPGATVVDPCQLRILPLAECPEHLPELAALQQAQWQYLNPQRGIEGRIQGLEKACSPGSLPLAWVAIDPQGTLLGGAMLVAQDLASRPELGPWLAAVLVKPAYRRQGVATALVAQVEAAAWSRGYMQIFLYTDQQVRFYAGRGWLGLEDSQHAGVRITVMTKFKPLEETAASSG